MAANPRYIAHLPPVTMPRCARMAGEAARGTALRPARPSRPIRYLSPGQPCYALAPGSCQRRGMLLLVVLLIIALLALVATTFSFKMQADLAAVKARQDLLQAEQAARAGIDRAIKLLRDQRVDIDQWYNNPNYFRRTLIWAPDKIGGSESLADQEPVPGRPAWRVSVVAYEVQGIEAGNNEVRMRYGVTDEASKININTASRAQLLALFDQIKPEDVTAEQLADALIDWRDRDDTPISVNGAESSYYMTLDPPYRAKNRPFETVEELLMVKGFNGRILYGEDYNRNGYLDPNEDDGRDGMFPFDNADGKLDRGLLPYLTVYSWDWNLSNDNKRRVDLNTADFRNVDRLPQHIREEVRPEILEFIAEARQRGYRFRSVGELLGLEVFEDGSSNYDDAWRDFLSQLREAGRVLDRDRPETQESDGEQPGRDQDRDEETGDRGRDERDDARGGRDGGWDGRDEDDRSGARGRDDSGGDTRGGSRRDGGDTRGRDDDRDDEDQDVRSRKGLRQNQSINVDPPGSRSPGRGRSPAGGRDEDDLEEERGRGGRGRDEDDRDGRDGRRGGDRRGDDRGSRGGRDGRGSGSGSGRGRGTPLPSPVTPEDLPVLMDRFTVNPVLATAGLINVNTALPVVINTIPGLTPEQAEAIIERRAQVDAVSKLTPAWLVTSGAIDAQTFALISNQITTRSIQFTIDAIGFADHTGTFKRLQAVVEMRGQLAQIRYFRDISSLGIGYPVHDDERSEGFAFDR